MKKGNPVYSLDDVLEKNEIGRFHYMLLMLCGLSFMADALEVNLLTFLATCAAAEWNLSATQQASITSVVFAGIISGSMFWGSIADRYGRRYTFIAAASVITFAGILTCIAPSYPYILLFRGIVGFGIGGANVPFDLLAEFLPSNSRGAFLIYIEYFWTIGSMFVAGVAWGMLSDQGWRWLAGITVIPIAVSSFFSIFYLPESPRWLLSMGEVKKAEEVIQQAFAFNGRGDDLPPAGQWSFQPEETSKQHRRQTSKDHHHPSSTNAVGLPSAFYEANSPLTYGTTTLPPLYLPSTSAGSTGIRIPSSDTGADASTTPQSVELTSYWVILQDANLRKVSLPLWGVWMIFGFTYYGLILFVGRVYDNKSSSNDDDGRVTCSFDYSSIFLNSLSELVGTTICILFIERIGRVNMQVIFYFLAGLFVSLISVPSLSPTGILVLAFIGRMSIMASTNSTWVLTPELYPTEIRTFGHAICVSFSKIGAFICPYIVISDISIPAVAVILGIANLIASFCAFQLPDTTGLILGEKRYSTRSISIADPIGSLAALTTAAGGDGGGGGDAMKTGLLTSQGLGDGDDNGGIQKEYSRDSAL